MTSHRRELTAHIFDIQGYSVHDGPGCRTLIFMSGCPLRCFWCSNPEGLNVKPALLYYQARCILCGNCALCCPHHAISVEEDTLIISREHCMICGEYICVGECTTGALRTGGYEIGLGELTRIVKRDRQFWGPGGGITLTGGEPLMQIDFTEALLKSCFDSYIHTAIETCGNVPWSHFQRVIPCVDWIFFDLKNIDGPAHEKATGADNATILANAAKLASEYKGRLIFRLPLIPGFNDSDESLTKIADFLTHTGKDEINILPQHHLGREKYKMLGMDYPREMTTPSSTQINRAKHVFMKRGIRCYIGSETPF